MRMTPLSLAHLTALDLPPPELIRVAGRIGFRTVGLRLLAVTDRQFGKMEVFCGNLPELPETPPEQLLLF